MAKKKFSSVDQYLAAQPKPAQAVLARVRTAIRKALPGAEEVIAYQIPAIKLHGRVVIYFAGWKQHYSLYPCTDRLVARFKDELEPYQLNGKGTIRFPMTAAVPTTLIARIAKFRAKESAELAKSKTSARATVKR